MVRVSGNTPRDRADMCPGALRPWQADDGLLVRLRLIGGQIPVTALERLLDVSARFGDGQIHLTRRANLQLRAMPGADGMLTESALAAVESTGLLPTRSHELVRNILVSPQTGLAGGRADLRAVAGQLDRLLCADPALARLPGRFLFTLDDGRGDLIDRLTGQGRRGTDLGLAALDGTLAQLRIGNGWGDVVTLDDAACRLADLATQFVTARGAGPDAPWHVRELSAPLVTTAAPDPRLPQAAPPLPFGAVAGGVHEHVPDGVLTPERARALIAASRTPALVVTPWHGILVPELREATDDRF